MNKDEAQKYFELAAEKHPTELYNQIKKQFGSQFRTYTKGYEKAPASRRAMVDFLILQAEQSGNIENFIKSF